MATTNFTKMKIAESMVPTIFQGDEDLDIFIADCKRYFELCGLDEGNQSLMVKCLIRRDLLPIYEGVIDRGQSFEEKLKEAFQKPSSLIGDFMEIYNYEKNEDTALVYFEKVERLVKKLIKHSWTEEQLNAYFLVHCVKDKEIKREIRMREARKIDEIKSIIQKVDAINVEVSGIAVIQRKETFANVVKKRQEFADLQSYRKPTDQRTIYNNRPNYIRNQNYEPRKITCWTCNEVGHTSRDCQKNKRVLTCYTCGKEGHFSRDCLNSVRRQEFCWACKEEGHIRSNCPNICCSKCTKRGHLKFQCRENQNRAYNQFYSRPAYNKENEDNRRYRIAAMTSEDEVMQRNIHADDDDAGDVITRDYPNARASTLGEMIGAME